MLDPMIPLALGLHSGKGVYALLLGSGISSNSGIFTGWKIVVDLIQKMAALNGKDCGDDPAAWYFTEFGKEPDYSDLLAIIAGTSTERMQILKSYFEPTPEEIEQNLKVPTAAHKAIAALVAEGYIRVIVTTNFDRLMERALEAVNVTPVVISSADDVRGAVPLPHSPCTIFKVHGDYLDSRLKNTPGELSKYDPPTRKLLGRIFDEYGLIVCGWSAEWDIDLRGAIERCPTRRYTTYWSAFKGVTDHAAGLCQKRAAQIIDGMDADTFFKRLGEKVTALRDMEANHPLSAPMAVATVKRYLPNKRDEIRVHDLVIGEAGRVATTLFGNLGPQKTERTLKEYEDGVEIILPLLATAGYWGNPGHRRTWLRAFHELVTPRSGPFPGFATEMDYYPTWLVLHAYGIVALAHGRLGNLAYILANCTVKTDRGSRVPMIQHLVTKLLGSELESVIRKEVPAFKDYNLVASRYVSQQLREPLREWISENDRYNNLFAQFEYLIGLVFSDIYQADSGHFGAIQGLYLGYRLMPGHFQEVIEKQKERWPFLRVGLFKGSLDRLREAKAGHDKSVDIMRMRMLHY